MRHGSRALGPVILGVVLAMSLAAGCSQQSGTRDDTGDQNQQDQQSLRLDIVEQWLESAHARPVTRAAEEEGCKNCHDGETFSKTGGGFVGRIAASETTGTTQGSGDATGGAGGGTGGSTAGTGTVGADQLEPRDWVVPMDCRVCHSGAGADIGERGTVDKIPSLDEAKGGLGAMCMACHNGWHPAGAGQEGNAAAPHYSVQTDMLFGVNTMQAQGSANTTGSADTTGGGGATQGEDENVSPHAKVKDTCVGCHVTGGGDQGPNHTFRVENYDGCERSGCHEGDMTDGGDAEEDYDGDGNNEKVTAEVEGLMEDLKAAIIKKARVSDFRSERGDVVFEGGKRVDVNSPEYAAAYNYLFVDKDKSRGIHNAKFTVKLLQDSIASLE